jgi:hypothetical protein
MKSSSGQLRGKFGVDKYPELHQNDENCHEKFAVIGYFCLDKMTVMILLLPSVKKKNICSDPSAGCNFV